MNQILNHAASDARWPIRIAGFLAALAVAASLSIAVSTGWQSGAIESDRWQLVVVRIFAVLAAHLLPALGQRLKLSAKCVCAGLWLTCVAYTMLGQAGFLLAAQERSGFARAQAVVASEGRPTAPGRDLPTILNDKARLDEQLVRMTPWPCDDGCSARVQLRRAGLAERLKALDAEAQASEDWRQERMRVERRAQQAADDPAGAHLAVSFGVTYGTVTGLVALTFAVILEGVGCFCWSLLLKPAGPPTTGGTVPAVAAADLVTEGESHGVTSCSHEDSIPGEGDSPDVIESIGRSLADDVARVAEIWRDSEKPLTVVNVRQYLHCGQRRASEVRREVAGLLLLTDARD
jgi:hypothetical protein